MKNIGWMALAVCASGWMACGDGDADGGGVSGGSLTTADDLMQAWGQAECDRIIRCGAADEDMLVISLMAKENPTACGAAYAREFIAPTFESAFADGSLTFDAGEAKDCLDWASKSCDVNIYSKYSACRKTLVGKVALDGACTLDEQCAGDAYCRGAEALCPGVCTQRVAEGALCTDDSACSKESARSLYCRESADGETRVCQQNPAYSERFVELGEPCGWLPTDAAGLHYARCSNAGEPLACGPEQEDGMGRCIRYTAKGEACTDESVCVEGALCQDLGSGKHCEGITVTSKAGAACNERDPRSALVVCNSLAGLTCGAGATCITFDGKDGSPCDDDALRNCAKGYYCADGGDGPDACAKTLADGEACINWEDCASGYCNSDSTCAAPVCD